MAGKMKHVVIGDKGAPNALADNAADAIAEVAKAAGFVAKGEIFRSTYPEKGEAVLGAVLLKGKYQGKDAVLKVQGLKLEEDEAEIIAAFEKQNKSKIVHAPKIYRHERWDAAKGYGFTVMELIDAPHIYNMPYADPKQMGVFCVFYQEYRTKAVTRPWIENPFSSPDQLITATAEGVGRWVKKTETARRLKFEEYAPCVLRFYPLAARHLPSMQMSFMHRELTAQHIFANPDGSFVITSNILWGYRLQWSDLSYNIWQSMMKLRDVDELVNDKVVIKFIDDWINAYREMIPVTKSDPDFERKITFLVLERLIGAIVGDLGFGEHWDRKRDRIKFDVMLDAFQGAFNHFADKLEKMEPPKVAPSAYISK